MLLDHELILKPLKQLLRKCNQLAEHVLGSVANLCVTDYQLAM